MVFLEHMFDAWPDTRTTLPPHELREHVLRVGRDATPDDVADLTADLLALLYVTPEAARS